MALKDIFKTKEDKKEKDKKKKKDKKAKKDKKKKKKREKGDSFENFAYRVLKSPYITEKALRMSQDNKYVFKVYNKANKIEIRKAVESLYGVDVEGVRVLRMPRKSRRIGRTEGWRSGFKKAIVKVKKGQKIEELIR